jgi:hypothetical protein
MSFETLSNAGFLFTDTDIVMNLLTADFGDGYEAASVIGDLRGLRTWTVKIDALPDNFDYLGHNPATAVLGLLLESGSPVLLETGVPVELGGIVSPVSDVEIPTGETRAEYLWQFFLRSKAAGNQPFWIWDVKTNKSYLVSFTEHRLSYQIFCAQVYGAGLQLKQRRVRSIVSPI